MRYTVSANKMRGLMVVAEHDKIILASSSSSRKMILNKLQLPYQAISPEIDEQVLEGEGPEAHVLRLAKNKALKVSKDLKGALVIGCDSVCVLNGKIVSKPENHAEALQQLKDSSGKIIYFYSGLVLYNTQVEKFQEAVIKTEVHFKVLSEPLIEAYLKQDQPYQCAGSIKAEGLGVVLIKKMIADDPNSLVGLPLIKLIEMLENEGVKLL